MAGIKSVTCWDWVCPSENGKNRGIAGKVRSSNGGSNKSSPSPSISILKAIPNRTDDTGVKKRGINMKDMMSYKGYFGSVHYSDDDQVFFGNLEFIRALVSYEGTDVNSLKSAFEEAVEDYLKMCVQIGKEPEKPFKGSFNIRLDPSLHQRLVSQAMNEGKTLNAFIKSILERALSPEIHS
jgi:predicted HicB family RNase H-like nuclease